MSDLYDANSDDAAGGDCCSRITYVEYPQILCNGIDCIKQMQEQTNSVPTNEQLDTKAELAIYCLNLSVFNKVHWKICHRVKEQILRLRLNLVYNVLRSQLKVVPANLMGILIYLCRQIFTKH